MIILSEHVSNRTMNYRTAARILWVAAATSSGGACARSPRVVVVTPPAPTPPAAERISTGPAVIAAMHDRYAGKWYGTITFRQKTTILPPTGGQIVQTWYEAGRLPGSLRIDTDTMGGGVLYTRDSLYRFVEGKLAAPADTGHNPLLLLGFDVYAQPTERSANLLRHLGFDLTRIHEDTWEGKPVFVVGAFAGDTTSRQFWITRDDLLFVRLIERRATRAGDILSEVRFNKYVRYGGGWVAEEVVQLTNGKPRLTEAYSDVKVNVPLADAVFDPLQWRATMRWMK